MSQEDRQATDRRSFLKLACFGAAATTATVVSGTDKAEGAEVADTSSRGYRETEHVLKVYETARF